jgi:hypothetical protein
MYTNPWFEEPEFAHIWAGLTVTVYAPAGQVAFTTASALHHEV